MTVRSGLGKWGLVLGAILLFWGVGCETPSYAPSSAPSSARSTITSATDASAPSPDDTPNYAAPPYYRVSGRGGATLYLLGTVHLGPPDGWDFAPRIDQDLAEADAFIMELDLRSLDNEAVGNAMAARVILPAGTELGDVTSPETQKLIEENDALITSLGMPPLARKFRKPWYLAISLLQVAIARTPYELEASAENQIVALIGDRPLSGLETFDAQLGLFDSLSMPLQDLLLRDSLGRLDETAAEMERLVNAWKASDRASLHEISRQGIDEYPDLEAFYDVLLRDRNRSWVVPLRERLDHAGLANTRIFVAVGALHLVGNDGVPALLEAAGYDVERLY